MLVIVEMIMTLAVLAIAGLMLVVIGLLVMIWKGHK